MTRRRDGFALVAALAATVVFAGLAFQVTADGDSAVELAQADVDRARLEAAAQAGLALAIDGLSRRADEGRWAIDGRARPATFDGLPLTIIVEDERGKIPINLITERETRRMFEAAGANARLIATLTDSFLDWRDEDDQRRANGAEREDYLPRGYRPRDGAFRAVEELALVAGMTPALYERLAPACTVFFGESGGFAIENAQPLALVTMGAEIPGGTAGAARRRQLAGGPPAQDRRMLQNYRGRALTVRVLAEGPRDSRLSRAWIIELTGQPSQPFWVRARL